MNYPEYILSEVAKKMSCDNLLNYNLSRFAMERKIARFRMIVFGL